MRILALVVALVLAASAGTWAWPAPSREVARAFDAPATPYGPGHRGIDIAAEAGAPVVAVADGTVRFAGMVAGRPVVSIDHGAGLVSSVEPVEPSVRTGDPVARGDPIGTLLAGHADAEGRPSARIHLGARLHGAYVDPLPLLGVERPVLLPLGAPKTGRAH